MSEHHRKIDLQASADLTYLHTNIKDAAQTKLDIHFPPAAAPQDGDDAFRSKVEELVQKYISDTFSLALPNVTINGLDVAPSTLQLGSSATDSSTPAPGSADHDEYTGYNDPGYTSYDPRLTEKLRFLHAQIENETTRLAEMRRDAPAKAAALYAERLLKEVEQSEREMEHLRDTAKKEGERRGLMGTRMERAENVRDSHINAMTGLDQLRHITEIVAKAERARRSAEEANKL